MKNQRVAHKKVRKNTIKKDSAMDKTLRSSFLGILITVGVSFTIMLASTAAALLTDDPTAFVNPIGYVLPFICAILGGFICSKLNKSSPYLTSIICAFVFVLLSMLLSFALPHSLSSEISPLMRIGLHSLHLIAFLFGTFVGIKSSTNTKKNKKRRRN